tara:strand:- start:597 stop:788 length:192 start_codon:yes stop_codon:yes gene_type:complete
VTYVSKKSFKKVKFIVDFFYICGILISVMRDRKIMMKEWKSIPENERPTWEQFKRGLKKKPKK